MRERKSGHGPRWLGEYILPVVAIFIQAFTYIAYASLLLSACRSSSSSLSLPPPERGSVRVLQAEESDRPDGPAAALRANDILLENAAVRFVIAGMGHREGVSVNGGDILDAIPRSSDKEAFGQLATAIGQGRLLPVRYRLLEMRPPRSSGKAGQIFLQGACADNPQIQVETEYTLEPDSNCLIIITKALNTGAKLENIHMGDMAIWGAASLFAPGAGRSLTGENTQANWVAADRERSVWGLFSMEGVFSMRRERYWTEILSKRVSLPPLRPIIYERAFIAGEGGPSLVSDTWQTQTAKTPDSQLVPVEFTVLSNNDGEPVKSAEIVYSNSDGIASTLVVTDEEGKGGCLLPAGTWHVKIISDRYSTLAEMPIEVKPDIPFASQVRLPPRKPLTISVADETTGGDTPAIAKVTIESVHGENPELSILPGSPFRNNTIVVSHMPQTIYLDPGKYVVTASRGPAFTIDSRAIQTNDRAEQSETFRIRRLFSRDEYLNIDMNLHSAAGFGGPLTASELASICMAEGLDAAVVENDVVRVASTSTPAKTSGFTFIPGIQVWNAGCGVFNLMPVPPELIRPDLNTALPSECNQTIRRIALRPNIVITSPLERRYGYFNLTGLDTTGNLEGIAEAQSEFDAIEFSREKNPGDTDALLHEWFQLLNTGSQVAAVGASESDIRSRREPGCFRTSIPMPSGTGGIATAEAICNRIIKDRMGIVTNGPMIRISANKDGLMGSLINARGGVTKIRVTVEAAPWVSTATLELVINGAVATTAILSDGPELKRFDSIFTIPVDRDSWVVAVVRGKRGMHPVIQGKGEAAVIPMAFTNPVWLDADGDGGFSRPPPKR